MSTLVHWMRRRVGALVTQGMRLKLRIALTGLRKQLLQVGSLMSAQTRTKGRGKQCLFSSCVKVRTTNFHFIIALPSRRRINRGRDVRFGNRVWLGKDGSVLKGVTIGDDSIIGMKSLVASRIPSNCVASGIPAPVLMHDVAWLEERIYE